MIGKFRVDQDAAKRLAGHAEPMIFFLINEKKQKIKLMRLMIESLRNEDVRRLQVRLRRLVAQTKLRRYVNERYQYLVQKRVVVKERQLFLRIYLRIATRKLIGY